MFAKGFAAQARANGFNVKRIDPGAHGGIAVCAEQSKNEKVAICAWGTHDSMGELVPTVPGYGAGTWLHSCSPYARTWKRVPRGSGM